MTKIKLKYCLLFLSGLVFSGCQEVFKPSGLDTDDRIMVVNGYFNDFNSLVNIDLQYSSPFGQNGVTYINDAIVLLKDNFGNVYRLYRTFKTGNYAINRNEISIIRGAKYYVRIETSNGAIYESMPEEIPKPLEISDVNAENGIYTTTSKDASGKVYTDQHVGVYVNVSARSTDNSKSFIRFDITGVEQTHYWVTPLDMEIKPYDVRCVDFITLNPYPVIDETQTGAEGESIKNKKTGFAYFINDETTVTEISEARTSIGWVIYCDVYSISPQTYLYYKKIQDFLTDDSKIFDPMPSQITGNIKCVSDTNKVVLGNFEVASGQRKYYAFCWVPSKTGVVKKKLETYNPPDSLFCVEVKIQTELGITFDSTYFNNVLGYNWIEFN